MAVTAPLRVPVEIRRSGAGGSRWFRLASGVSELGLVFPRALPAGCDGPLDVAFVLPGGDRRIELVARVVSIETGDTGGDAASDDEGGRERLRALRFVAPDEDCRARIAGYVAARVPE
jgi:hypothetical protein